MTQRYLLLGQWDLSVSQSRLTLMVVAPDEKRYRVTTEYKSLYQIVVEATSPEEAEYFAKAIDLDKWQHIETDFEIVDVSKDFFLKKVQD